MTKQNTSKFAICLEYGNQHCFFFIFHFVLLYFSQMNALVVYVDISNTHSLGGKIKSHEMKKTTWNFVFQKYGKTWSVSLGHFIKHKLLILEEWRSWLLMLDLRVWLFKASIASQNLQVGDFFVWYVHIKRGLELNGY